ncbi:MAG: hypothetical protein Barrevirus1_64 [Barrevirus sp.]|uniref:VWFA domain-containing protein n=1 Tax=Barrevirus sp. TaxID=2487763 RepID=A0A3G4ZPL2_9VIRU|nr:MAG: hypothetical protein Barrevirus1_64 [Barrevirus sp.]
MYASAQPSAPQLDPTVPSLSPNQGLSKFELLVKQNELNPYIADKLREVLSTCEIVLLCDDSDSMSLPIAEEGTDPFSPKRSTRWLELKKLAAIIIQFVTAVNDSGLDIYFLNRPKVTNVVSVAGLQSVFSVPPTGSTNLMEGLNSIYNDKRAVFQHKKLLIVVVSDGEPNDNTGSNARQNLYDTIDHMVSNSNGNIHISFAECTDNAEDMEYLDAWDGRLKNFDNTEDYREELLRIKTIQGQQFKFDFTDYVIKILLATFVRWFFNLDQVKVTNSVYSSQGQGPAQQKYVSQVYQPTNTQPIYQQAPQPVYQAPQTQPVYQAPQTQPVYQAPQTQPVYQAPQAQPVYQQVYPRVQQQQQQQQSNSGGRKAKGCHIL